MRFCKALRQLKKRIGVKRSDKAFVAEVYVTSERPGKSVRIADAVAQAYLDDQTESREAVLSQTIGQLRTQYAEVARQRAELGALVGPRHPSITNLDAQIVGVQKL